MKARLASHRTSNESKATQVYVTRIDRQFPNWVLALVLFGSKALGNAASATTSEESDIDLLLLMDWESDVVRSELLAIASDVSLEYDVVLSVRVYGRARGAESRRIRLPLYRAIVSERLPLISDRIPT